MLCLFYDKTHVTKTQKLLQQQLDEVPNANLLSLMGDFNAKLGCEVQLSGGAIGRFGLPAPITDDDTRCTCV